MQNEPHPRPRDLSKAALRALIADLEAPNPSDEFPGATRGLVAHLRVCEGCGVEEMMDGIEASIVAAFGAIMTFAPSTRDGITVAMAVCIKVAKEWSRAADDAAAAKSPKAK